MANRYEPTTLHLYRIHISIILDNEEEMYDRSSYNIHMPENEDFFIDIPPGFRLVYRRLVNSICSIDKLDLIW